MGSSDWLVAGAVVGDYVIDQELAAKPGLVAWSAKHALLPRRARITTVHPAYAGSPAMASELTREACVLEALRHAGVPRVFECGELRDRRPWIASELIEGPSLSLLLVEEGKLGVPMVLTLLAGIAEILHHAHARGLVHRNLCPDAIACCPEGPCIVDWSNARGPEGDGLQLVASDWLAYQPPEVIAGEPADSRSDVFSLGLVAYEALTGDRPVAAAAPRLPGVPARLIALLDRMMSLDPLARPMIAEVRAEALAIVEQIEIPVPPPADEDGPDVQIEDVELGHGLAADTESDLDADPPAAAPPAPPARPAPPSVSSLAGATLTWSLADLEERARPRAEPPVEDARTKTDPMTAFPEHLARTKTESMLPEHLARTKTESMLAEHLGVSRVKTEPMPGEPEPRLPRTSTRAVKLAPRGLEPARTKTP
jgi:serine/threonine protein kinase